MRAEELEKQLEEIKTAQAQQRDAREKAVEHEVDKRVKLIRSLIKFRDQLLIFRDNTEDEEAVKLLSNLYRETGRFMMENGIEILNGQGDLSTDNQIVVGTVETEDTKLINTIESTFRDGYILDNKMLRPQEVVVYVQER
jgi:molecular chaperone GrpE (heat shock protein)